MTNEEFIEFLDEAKESVDCTRFLVSGGKTSFAGMTNEFKPGDQVKWVDPDNELEMIFGEVVNWCPHPDRTGVRNLDVTGLGWVTFVKTADLHHAHEVDRPCYAGEPIAEKKGYQPDGFDREAFDDFMRNL